MGQRVTCIGALHPKPMFIKLPTTLNTDMISNLSYCCVPAACQEKPSFIFEGNLNPPESRARHLT